MQKPSTLSGRLAYEISRVTSLRCQYESLRGQQGVNVEPAIALMNAALADAIAAMDAHDAAGQIAAVKDLEGFAE